MIIKKIEINNFRSYYKLNVFELVNGLNLIIGSNGDGKTTFYEALEWLFRTDGSVKVDTKLISKKRSEELSSDESDEVRVSMTYEHKGYIKTLEKSFRFTKSYDGEITTSNFSFEFILNYVVLIKQTCTITITHNYAYMNIVHFRSKNFPQ
mgnify:CR=1 FL=1